MSSLESGLYQLGRLDQLAYQDTAVHRLDPRAKVITTLVFLVCVVSFGKYELVRMLPFALFPLALAIEGNLPLGFVGTRLLIVSPFAVLIGMFNPLFDQTVVAQLGGLEISGGWVSFASIILRFLLTTSAAFVLIGITSFNGISAALERLGVPDVFATQLLLLYRYIFVLADEGLRMGRSRQLRSFGRRGMGLRVYGNMLGHLLLRTYDRAQRVYLAMQCRGFDGHVRVSRRLRLTGRDSAFVLGWSAAFVAFRIYNVPLALGQFVTRLVA
ncbi:MAG: cobalt ECF transporter T component CbiQ [Thermoleophilia bacterium]